MYVIDDDPSVQKALERLLRSAGHEAKIFSSAVEFLDFTCPDAPGCIVLDIKMPNLSGLELQEKRERVDELKRDNSERRQSIEELGPNGDGLEGYAREKGYAKEGEIIQRLSK